MCFHSAAWLTFCRFQHLNKWQIPAVCDAIVTTRRWERIRTVSAYRICLHGRKLFYRMCFSLASVLISALWIMHSSHVMSSQSLLQDADKKGLITHSLQHWSNFAQSESSLLCTHTHARVSWFHMLLVQLNQLQILCPFDPTLREKARGAVGGIFNYYPAWSHN